MDRKYDAEEAVRWIDSSARAGFCRAYLVHMPFNIIYIMRTNMTLERIQRIVIMIALVIYR
ncbi:hypothetical protein BBB57_03740 [Kosakonia sacchari]|nr:hypothetical protein BBB57_03740 [Kosakonia sacchari]